MKNSIRTAILGVVAFLILPSGAFANMSYSPWVHEIVQNGADMEVTVSVFEETTETNYQGEPLPGFEVAYTLERWIDQKTELVFENRVFKPEEADEVTDYTCQSWDIYWGGEACDSNECEDCDGDDVPECFGFCGVAYRYKVTDECPPPGEIYYFIYTNPPYDLYDDGEGLGFTNTGVEDIGAACQDEDNGCSVSGVSRSKKSVSFLAMAIEFMI